MTRSIIPWHVFRNAIETPNPYSLDHWLQRWRFMDTGVILSDTNIPALELPQPIVNLLCKHSVADELDSATDKIQSPQPARRVN